MFFLLVIFYSPSPQQLLVPHYTINTEMSSPKKRFMQCPECQEPLLVTKKWWEKQGNGGGDYEWGVGLICRTHEAEYEIYEEGGEQ